MDILKKVHEDAKNLFIDITNRLEEYQLLTDADSFQIMTVLDSLRKEQSRCIQDVCSLTGCTADQCTTIPGMEHIVSEYQLSKAKEAAHQQELLNIVGEFASITATDHQYDGALLPYQQKLQSYDLETLLTMDNAGELDIYRQFITCAQNPNVNLEDAKKFLSPFGPLVAFALADHKLTCCPCEKPTDDTLTQLTEESPSQLQAHSKSPNLPPEEAVIPPPTSSCGSDSPLSAEDTTPATVEISVKESVLSEPSVHVSESSLLLADCVHPSKDWPVLTKYVPNKKIISAPELINHFKKLSNPQMWAMMGFMESLLNIDYSPRKYLLTTGTDVDTMLIKQAIDYLKNSGFITTYRLSGSSEENVAYGLRAEAWKILNKPIVKKELPFLEDIGEAPVSSLTNVELNRLNTCFYYRDMVEDLHQRANNVNGHDQFWSFTVGPRRKIPFESKDYKQQVSDGKQHLIPVEILANLLVDSESTLLFYLPLYYTEVDSEKSLTSFFNSATKEIAAAKDLRVALEVIDGEQEFWLDYCRTHLSSTARYYVGIAGQDCFMDESQTAWSYKELLADMDHAGGPSPHNLTIPSADHNPVPLQPTNCADIQTTSNPFSSPTDLSQAKAIVPPVDEVNEVEKIPTAAEIPSKAEEVSVATEIPSETEEVSTTAEIPSETEGVSATAEIPSETEEVSATAEIPSETEEVSATVEIPNEAEEVSAVADAQPIPDGSSQEIAAALLVSNAPLSVKGQKQLLYTLVAESHLMEAVVLAKSLTFTKDESLCHCYQGLLHGTGIPLEDFDYYEYLNAEYENTDDLSRFCYLSATLWALCFPQNPYDHRLYRLASDMIDSVINAWLPAELTSVKNLLSLLSNDLKDISFNYSDGLGISESVRNSLASDMVMEQKHTSLINQAREKINAPRSNIKITGLETAMKAVMGPTGDLGICMQAIVDDDTSQLPFIREIASEYIGDDGTISNDRIQVHIDETWDNIRHQMHLTLRSFSNDSPARNVFAREIRRRLEIICDWLQRCDAEGHSISSDNLNTFKSLLAKIIEHLQEGRCAIHTLLPTADAPAAGGLQVLLHMLNRMEAIISGTTSPLSDPKLVFVPLLTTPYMVLMEDGLPQLNPILNDLPGMEPWRMMLRHIAADPAVLADTLPCLEDAEQNSDRFEDYGSAELVRAALGLPAQDYTSKEIPALMNCNALEDSFRGEVRLACAYGQVKEETKETVFSQIAQYRSLFIPDSIESAGSQPIGNYSHYRMLLDCLRQTVHQAKEETKSRYMSIYEDFMRPYTDDTRPPILAQVKHKIDHGIFATAEAYLSRFQSGEMELPEDVQSQDDFDFFHKQFIDCADVLCAECEKKENKGSKLSKWAPRVLQEHNYWSSSNERNATSPVEHWINRKDDPNTPQNIRLLLQMLGIQITQIEKSSSHPSTSQYEVFRGHTVPISSNREDYSHPVMKFGTQLPSVLHVVCLYGCKGSPTLIDIMTNKLQLGGAVIVLMDGVLSLLERRRVAAQFKANTSGQNSFLLIDRVLLLYLSALDSGYRARALLQCTLPYTYEQLYTEGSGAVAEEMFIGRISDRKSLSDPQGACLVYGGRQLGKTALLRRVESINNDPAKRYYSVYLDIKERGSDYFLRMLLQKLQDITIGGKSLMDGNEQNLDDICQTLTRKRSLFDRLLILVDEVDRYFDEIARDNYNPLHPVIVLQDELKNKVKFVFAGTHNVAATRQATENNSDIIKLRKPLCIQPLSPADATNLIRKPLSYLGFHIGEEQIALILSNTNSYPGLIHLFCNSLVKSVCDNYDKYYSASNGNPPYSVSDEQLQQIFRDTDIKKEISDRVIATIKLDRKYRIVSNLLAFLEYTDQENGQPRLYGYTPEEVQACNMREELVTDFMPDHMPLTDLKVLMDEMARMGILWKNNKRGSYRFQQRDFIGYIGTYDKVVTSLLEEVDAE